MALMVFNAAIKLKEKPMNRYDYVFFDNDGILVDTEHLYYEANRQVLHEAVNVDLTMADYKEINLTHGQSVLALAGEKNNADLLAWRNKIFAALIRERRDDLLLPDVHEVLAALRSMEVKMAVVTSSRREHFELIHSFTGVLPYFEFYLIREDYEHSKPSPDPYLAALAHSKADRERCLIIEDTPRGVKAAQRAEIDVVAKPNHLLLDADFYGADIIDSLKKIPAIVRK